MELKTRNAARQALVPPKLEDVSPNVDTMETLPMDMDYKTPSPVVTKTNLFTPDKVDQIKKGLGDSFDTSMAKDPCEVQPIVTTGSNENSPDCLQDPYQMAEVSAAAPKPGTAGDVPAKPSLRRGDGLDPNHEDGEHGGLHPEVAGEPDATLENLGDEIPPLPADTNHEDGEHGGLHPEVAGEPDATLENLGDEIPPLPADTNHEDGEHGGLHPEVAGETEATLENLGDEIPPLPADTNHEDGEHGGLHPEVAGEHEATLENLGDEIPPLPADTNHEDGEHGGLHAEIGGDMETIQGKGDASMDDSSEVAGEPEATLENLDDEFLPSPADPDHEDGEHGGLDADLEIEGDLETELDEVIEKQGLDRVPLTLRVEQFANKKIRTPKAEAKGKAKAQSKAKARGKAKAKAAAVAVLGAKAKAKASSAKSRPRSRKQQPSAQHEALGDGEGQPSAEEPLEIVDEIVISEPELPEPAAPEEPRRGRKRRGDGEIKTFARRNMPKTFRSQSKWLAIRDSFCQHVRPKVTAAPSKFEDGRLTLLHVWSHKY